MPKIKIKPLSVNDCWRGRRFKTKEYTDYEEELLWLLPKIKVGKETLGIEIEVGFSNKCSDLDNITKPFIDILQKKYSFNDKQVYRIIMEKVDVKKGEDYLDFEIYNLTI